MNYLGLTVFAGNTPGLILDFDSATKEYTVEFTDGRVVKTTKVYWDKTIPSEPDIAFYRQSSVGNGEQLVYDSEIGWDVVSAAEDSIDIVDQPSDLGEWVDDYTDKDADEDTDSDGNGIEDKIDEVIKALNELKGDAARDNSVKEKSAVQDQDHDATEDSYWDRSTKPNPMAYDESFPSGNYNERNPGTLNPTAKVAKDCGCWDGYKRVPGTKPCAPGSCEKCDAAHKESAAKKQSPEEAVKKVNTVPPAGVRAAAKRGLKYHEEGKAGDGFEAATATRARKIVAGEALTEEHINRMHSFFERHAGGRSKKAKPGEVTAWDVAWLCWGGDAGRSWAAKVDAQLHKARHPESKGKHSADAGAGVIDLINNEDEIVLREPSGSSPERLLQKTRDLMTSDGQDYDGNPEMEFGEGGDEGETGMDRHVVHLDGVDLDTVSPDDHDAIVADFGELPEDDEEMDEEGNVKHTHVRAEAEWQDAHYAKGALCPKCSDPLVDSNCHNCGDNHEKHAKKIAKRNKTVSKIAKALQPQAKELGVLFGEALAGHVKDSVTAPSEDIFAIHIDGNDSDPSIGGTGGYNAEHGDAPEYLKDVNGIGGWIDATPELLMEGMPKVIELSQSDESGEGHDIVKILEEVLERILGKDFKDSKEKTKEEKNSSLKISGDGFCNACGKYILNSTCNVSKSSNPEVAPAGCEAVGQSNAGLADNDQGGNSVQNAQNKPMGVSQDIGYSSVNTGWSTAGKPNFSFSGSNSTILDSSGDPLEEGQTYRAYVGHDDTPEIIRIETVHPDRVSVSLVGDPAAVDARRTEDIFADEANANETVFDKEDIVNPAEIGMDSVPATDGTPETMDDAGPGHNDIPGVRDLSNAHMASLKEAGRNYLPNQQKEFINESGSARNLDKLILEGTHYVDGEVTASDNFDDDFLFGV